MSDDSKNALDEIFDKTDGFISDVSEKTGIHEDIVGTAVYVGAPIVMGASAAAFGALTVASTVSHGIGLGKAISWLDRKLGEAEHRRNNS